MNTSNESPRHFGSAEFCRRVECNGQQMLRMEAAGVVKPIKSTAGWRAFSDADVTAGKAWMKANVVKKRKAQ